MSPSLVYFPKIGTPTLGYISVAEIEQLIPFEIKRVYWTYYTPNHVIRGNHAHIALQQVIIAVSGIIEITLEDATNEQYSFKLENPFTGLYIPPGFWRVIKFSHNAVLLCIASEKYNEADYIRDYETFKTSYLTHE